MGGQSEASRVGWKQEMWQVKSGICRLEQQSRDRMVNAFFKNSQFSKQVPRMPSLDRVELIFFFMAHGLFILCSKNDSSLEAHSTEFAENSLQTQAWWWKSNPGVVVLDGWHGYAQGRNVTWALSHRLAPRLSSGYCWVRFFLYNVWGSDWSICFFGLWMSDCSSTICWKAILSFSTELFLHFCVYLSCSFLGS